MAANLAQATWDALMTERELVLLQLQEYKKLLTILEDYGEALQTKVHEANQQVGQLKNVLQNFGLQTTPSRSPLPFMDSFSFSSVIRHMNMDNYDLPPQFWCDVVIFAIFFGWLKSVFLGRFLLLLAYHYKLYLVMFNKVLWKGIWFQLYFLLIRQSIEAITFTLSFNRCVLEFYSAIYPCPGTVSGYTAYDYPLESANTIFPELLSKEEYEAQVNLETGLAFGSEGPSSESHLIHALLPAYSHQVKPMVLHWILFGFTEVTI